MKRASGELEKRARREEILVRAEQLFGERSFPEIRMADLATDLGLAKGTIYLYFRSKESLFLALVEKGLGDAFKRVLKAFLRPGLAVDAGTVAREVARAMAADPALPRLLSMLHSVLEQSLDYEEALLFKRGLAGMLEEAGDVVAKLLPPLSPEEGRRFFLYLYAQVVGLVSLTDISPFMKRIAAEPGLEAFRLGFEDTLADALDATLAGLLSRAAARDTQGVKP